MENIDKRSEYVFSTGLDSNLSGLSNELHRSEINQPADNIFKNTNAVEEELKDPNIPTDFVDEESANDEETIKIGKSVAQSGGKALARALDRVASVVLALIAHGEATDYRADKSELSDLETAFADFMQESGFQMSPGWNLMIAIMSIYGFKAMGALHDRKEYDAKVLKKD